ncbi:MAG: hypothetical protein IID41_00130 [Planctomycetes bacterium]|nr:hypothetical protein [Planctomycetota bacterium]
MTQIITLNDLQQEVEKMKKAMVTKQELESWIETLAIMSNDETMKQIEASEREIAADRGREIKSVSDLVE